jgi:undecaprenyl-diphosphatase
MDLIANQAFALDVLTLALTVVVAFFAFQVYARRVQTGWPVRLAARRLALSGLLLAFVVGIKVFEDVLSRESGPVDTALLWWTRQHVAPGLTGFFAAVTLSGAARFLVPLTALLCLGLLLAKSRTQAIGLALTMAIAWLTTYSIKTLVGRERPALWATEWYWGSSFPSGHTLSAAAFSTALALIAGQRWPRLRWPAVALAALWTSLVALSRLVLGVHWPTDVLAAVCLGVFIALAVSICLDLKLNRPNRP